MSHFGDAIQDARNAQTLAMQDLADKAGIKKSELWALEVGLYPNPTIKTIFSIGSALGINPLMLCAKAIMDQRGASDLYTIKDVTSADAPGSPTATFIPATETVEASP